MDVVTVPENKREIMPKPEPVIVSRVCSECGQPWDDHAKPTLTECVRLLKAALAKRPQTSWTTLSNGNSGTVTYIQPSGEADTG